MIEKRFTKIDRTIFITSGKGGVGKSMIAATTAALMAKDGMSIGLLDADVYGPSSAFIFKVKDLPKEERHGLVPPTSHGVKIMSVDLFVAGRPIPMSGRAARQIIKEILALTDWGALDCLIVDMPPGTGDVMMSLIEAIKNDKGSIVVTTPTALSVSVVQRVVKLLLEARIPILGVLENMSYTLDSEERPLGRGGGRSLASDYGIRFLGELPIDPKAAKAADAGNVQALLRTDFAERLSNSLKGIGLLKSQA
jgi:ATP-binding protein involved in chromosome partitioning